MKKYPLSALVLDFDFYPRGSIDSHHVGEIADAISAGVAMPPLVIDKAGKRVADGFHRYRAYWRLHGESFEVECVEKTYASDADFYIDAARFNAAHGRALTQHDKAHCLIRAKQLGIEPEIMAGALCISPERVEKLTSERVGRLRSGPVALKHTIAHMSGRRLTASQAAANQKLSGMNQSFYVHQLITLIENDLLDLDDNNLVESLTRLRLLLSEKLVQEAA